MGCGMVSQRGTTVLEVHRPLTQSSGGRASAAFSRDASQRSQTSSAEASSPGERRRRSGSSDSSGSRERPGEVNAERSADGGSDAGDRHVAQQGGRLTARRFMVGERITLTTRLPHNIQDHAFCFECGVFFHVGASSNPECPNCGSCFVQFLRSAQDQNWISADTPNAQGFAFDDQLDNSISASLDETPIVRKPTHATFLQSLKTVQLDKAEVEERALLGASDPRCNCAICRDTFVVGDRVQKLPCNHEFHADCVLMWLKNNNTCPICRWQLPEGTDGEEQEVRLKSNHPAELPICEDLEGAPSEDEDEVHVSPSDAPEARMSDPSPSCNAAEGADGTNNPLNTDGAADRAKPSEAQPQRGEGEPMVEER